MLRALLTHHVTPWATFNVARVAMNDGMPTTRVRAALMKPTPNPTPSPKISAAGNGTPESQIFPISIAANP